MTVKQMREKILKMEQELENLTAEEEIIRELKLKLMGQICAYEYQIQIQEAA